MQKGRRFAALVRIFNRAEPSIARSGREFSSWVRTARNFCAGVTADVLKDWLIVATQQAVVIIDLMALIVILIGTFEAFIRGGWVLVSSQSGHERRDVWLRYARWLVAGLTFQLAADIIETSITPSWEEIAKVGVVALIRTFLNFFLERDLADVRERQRDAQLS
jgi:uncharacterized membrane protein